MKRSRQEVKGKKMEEEIKQTFTTLLRRKFGNEYMR